MNRCGFYRRRVALRLGGETIVTRMPGVGVVVRRVEFDHALAKAAIARGIEVMTTLNAAAAAAARTAGAHALTDVTGFGLLGHAHELAAASGLAAEIDADAVPAIDGVLDLLSDERALAGGSKRNRRDADAFTSWADDVDPARARLVCDAMTSGGLLAALPAGASIDGWRVGRLVAGEPGTLRVS